MKFLLVDDPATTRRIVLNSLMRIGITNVVEAGSGAEALEQFDSSIGCVITDWTLPDMSSIDLARTLRARPDGVRVPILAVTTRNIREEIRSAFQAGINSQIVKPFTTQVLKQTIDQLLSTVGAAH